MQWTIFALIATIFLGTSDLFRKLSSDLKDPIFVNLLFQFGAFAAAVAIFLTSRKIVYEPKGIVFALIGGILISMATLFSVKALSLAPASTVIPFFRVGGVSLAVALGILILREKFTLQTFIGFTLAIFGLYLLFAQK